MRALRVVGVTGDGSVVLEDSGRRERYTVPADEQLRAAARGDVTRLGQIAIELESQLRPREIQARIRGGASVDEVAAAAGVPTQKIERFAYPVLLERSRTAELAQSAHPQRADGPDMRTLGETVAHTFGLRSQDYTSAGWDSWKGEDGKWVVVLTWQTGRSDNAAHWAFQPGAHGGTVVPLDEHASDLVEGLPARPLRPLGAVVDMARDDDQTPSEPAAAAPARAVAGGQAPSSAESWAGRGITPEQRRSSPSRPRVEPPARGPMSRPEETRAPAADAPVIPRVAKPVEDPVDEAADEVVDAAVTDMPASDRDPVDAGRASGSGTDTAPDIDSAPGIGSAPGTVELPETGTAATSGTVSDIGAASSAGTASGTGTASSTGTARDNGSTSSTGTASDGRPASDSAPAAGSSTASGGTSVAGATPDGGPDPGATSGGDAAATTDATPATGVGTDTAPEQRTSPQRDGGGAAASGGSTEQIGNTEQAGSTTPAAATETSTDAGTAGRTASHAGQDGSGTTDRAATAPAPADGTSAEPADTDEDDPARPASSTPDESSKQDADEPATRQRGSAASRRTKKGKPVMPSWDEVLLGVRGQR
ncbi:septation protein SepH [Pseudonocardia parietis]|uniref:DUF3071 domain-containing protein n=1 Tax=Pseudonocardia parietis TaxID=570936 RepID=A0ABS4W4N3_9PSEU|nr:septation protein SepH [Pseudonocardia parietis]MBP2371159.1 hypothetical protein [Pseudonocardia parietis]